jgi:hypothetical protein
MKKLKLFIVCSIFSISGLFAAEKVDDDLNTTIREQIVNLIADAKLETKEDYSIEDFRVEFSFTFNSAGEIVVLNVDTNRTDIKNYIRENINNKKIDNPGIKNDIYTMPITVKMQS